MNKRMKLSVLALAVAGALGLAGCGGSSGSADSSGTTTSGVITGFGSVFVNGVEYETGGASVSVDGASASEADLEVGMVVTLEGSVNADGTTGQAVNIEFVDDIEGVVLSNNIQAGSNQGVLNIMGQNVSVSADTVFESNDPNITGVDQLAANDLVEVSGYPSGNGSIYATRIERKGTYTAGQEIELKGIVGNLNPSAGTFQLGDLTVDYSSATDVPPDLANSLYVQVTTDNVPTPTSSGNGTYDLVATRVEVEGDGRYGHHGAEGEEFEMQGVVTAVGADHFMLNGRKVLLGQTDTEFDPTALTAGQTVRVEARFNADGDLVAHEVEFGAEGELEFQGAVEAVDGSSVTVFGQQIRLTATTRMLDEQDEGGVTPVKYFSAANINVGDYIEVVAYRDDTGALVATGVTRDDTPVGGSVQIQGNVDSLITGGFTVEGVPVDASGVQLSTAIALNASVEVHGTYANGVITATEVSVQQ